MSEKERAIQANETYCREGEENGIEICSWDTMPGWKSFVDGEIDEAQLSEQATQELADLAKTFLKYTVVDKEPSPEFKEELAKKKRAEIANKVYKKACVDSGKNLCFFKNFAAWQDFVHGEIGEAEFYRRAVEEIQKMAEQGSK